MIKLMEKLIAWWKGLSGWKKWLGATVFILVAALWIASMIMDKGRARDLEKIDEFIEDQTDRELGVLTEKDKEISRQINLKKVEIITKLNQAGVIDATTLARRKKIMATDDPDELDKLQKEYDL